jgi:heparin binding hemagglutinin HbhA
VIDMATVPTVEDVRKAGEQARAAVTGAFEQVRTPLLAALGAGDLATQAVVDVVNKTREQLTERAEAARSAAGELPTDVSSLREKLDPAELRKLVDEYADAAAKLYQHLAEQGEKALDKLRSQPQFKRAIDQLDQAVETAQQRAESAVEDARELADEVLGKVVRRTRSTGEKAAREVIELADDAAETVHEAGADVAHELRSTTRKAANRTNNVRKASTTKPATTRKTTES